MKVYDGQGAVNTVVDHDALEVDGRVLLLVGARGEDAARNVRDVRSVI